MPGMTYRFCPGCGTKIEDTQTEPTTYYPAQDSTHPRFNCLLPHYRDEMPTPKPDRLAELRAKYGGEGSVGCRREQCSDVSYVVDLDIMNTAIADINKALDMVEDERACIVALREAHDLHVAEVADFSHRIAEKEAALEAKDAEIATMVPGYNAYHEIQRLQAELSDANAQTEVGDEFTPVPGVTLACRKIDGEFWCRVTDFERLKGKLAAKRSDKEHEQLIADNDACEDKLTAKGQECDDLRADKERLNQRMHSMINGLRKKFGDIIGDLVS